MVAARKLRPPVKWHGGKAYLARRIVAMFPPHRVYVEPFAGGLSVLLNKRPAETEVAGDLNADLINLWQHVGCPFVQRIVATTPYEANIFETAKARLDMDEVDPVDRAIMFLVRNRFSRGGLGKTFAWSARLRGGRPGDQNAWETIRAELPAIAERVRAVTFYNVPAVNLIRAHDGPDALIYCDPPYLHETRTARAAYEHEMGRDDHAALLDALLACRGRVFLSGYRSEMYDAALAGWTRHDFEIANHSGQGKTKQRRVECVWTNTGVANG